jgi:hypothetical protein
MIATVQSLSAAPLGAQRHAVRPGHGAQPGIDGCWRVPYREGQRVYQGADRHAVKGDGRGRAVHGGAYVASSSECAYVARGPRRLPGRGERVQPRGPDAGRAWRVGPMPGPARLHLDE